MAFNVFFFSDESMHKTYETGGKHDWLGHLAQIAIAMVVSQILQVFVNFLTMTDIHYYELKGLKRDNKINGNQINIKKYFYNIALTNLDKENKHFICFLMLIYLKCARKTQIITEIKSLKPKDAMHPIIIYFCEFLYTAQNAIT